MTDKTVFVPWVLGTEDDGTSGIWARQIPHISARELAAAGHAIAYHPLFQESGGQQAYREANSISSEELLTIADQHQADRLIYGQMNRDQSLMLSCSVWDRSGKSLPPFQVQVDPGLMLAVLPRLHRAMARFCGLDLTGQPAYLAGARSEHALFALVVDLDNNHLMEANGGTIPGADPWATRYAPLVEALRRDPQFPEAEERLLERCAHSPPQEYELALRALLEAADLVPTPHRLLLERSRLQEVNKKLDDAAASAQQAVALEPGSADAHLQVGRLLLLSGHSNKARAHIVSASRIAPSNWQPAYWMARLHQDTGDGAQALPWWQRTLSLSPPDGPERRRAEQAVQRGR